MCTKVCSDRMAQDRESSSWDVAQLFIGMVGLWSNIDKNFIHIEKYIDFVSVYRVTVSLTVTEL